MNWVPEARLPEIAATDRAAFARDHAADARPVVIRGLVSDWPLVAAGRQAPEAARRHLGQFDRGTPTNVMRADPAENGRFFYADNVRDFNFSLERAPIGRVLDEVIALRDVADPPGVYAGSSPTAQHLPGFDAANPMPLALGGAPARIWIGNRTRIAPHYDVSDNVAAVALGRRRFTLFPPEATPDMYVGPLDITPAGQPVSMVDPAAPDLDRFPRYERAMATAAHAVLEPGDAIFIPTMWWHGVEALDPVNILVNYWYNDPPEGSPFSVLLHALASIRDLRPSERAAWKVWFDHYVFREDAEDAAAHLPPAARGVVGPPSERRTRAIRAYLLRMLG